MDPDEHRRHIWAGEPDEDLLEGLEPDQLWAAVKVPVPRRQMGRAGSAGFWALRVFLLVEAAAVIYAFVAALRA